MKPKVFFDKVAEMRRWQKMYFTARTQTALMESKRLEREIDEEIKRVQSMQIELFH